MPRKYLERQDFEDIRICPGNVVARLEIAMTQSDLFARKARGALHPWKVELHPRGHVRRNDRNENRASARYNSKRGDSINVLVCGNEALVAEFVAHEKTDHNRRGESHRKAADVDARVEPIAREVAQRRRQIIAKHTKLPAVSG